MAGTPINRTADGILLPPEVSKDIWSKAQAESVVMKHSSRINLPGAGIDVPLITGDPVASWVGETEKIKVGKSTFGKKSIRPRKVALIEMFSNEFKRDLPSLYSELAQRLPKTLAKAFDLKALHAPAEENAFDSLAGAATLTLGGTDTYGDIVEIDSAIYEADGVPDAYVVSPRARKTLLSARNADGDPLLLNSIVDGRNVPSLLGVDVDYSPHASGGADNLGVVGQWGGNAFYGMVESISVEVSKEAVIDISNGVGEPDFVSLFQQDMFALRVIAHMGFAVRDLSKFRRIDAEPEV